MPPPANVRPPIGFSLRHRLLLFTLGIVVVMLGLTLGIIDAFVRQQVRGDVAEELVTTGAVFERFLELRAGWMRAQSRVVAEDPRFSATLDLPDADPGALARTVLGMARRFQSILGSDLFIITDAQGLALAQLERSRPSEVESLSTEAGRQLWRVSGVDYAVTSIDVGGTTIAVGVIDTSQERPPDPGELARVADEMDLTALQAQPVAGPAARLQKLFDADLAAVVDARGQPLDIIVRHLDSGRDLSDWPSVRDGLRGEPTAGGLRIEGRRLFHVDVVPV